MGWEAQNVAMLMFGRFLVQLVVDGLIPVRRRANAISRGLSPKGGDCAATLLQIAYSPSLFHVRRTDRSFNLSSRF